VAHQPEIGERLSLTGYLIHCLAQSVQAHPMTNAYRNWCGQLVVFADVDVVTLIEIDIGGAALPHIIRVANS
jgi:hypothetical protein